MSLSSYDVSRGQAGACLTFSPLSSSDYTQTPLHSMSLLWKRNRKSQIESSYTFKAQHGSIGLQALAGMVQCSECQPANQKVAGSILSQGTCLGFGPGPQLGGCEKQPIDVISHTSMFLSLSFSLVSLFSNNK